MEARTSVRSGLAWACLTAVLTALGTTEAHAGPTVNGTYSVPPLPYSPPTPGDCGTGAGPGGVALGGDCYRLRIRCTLSSTDRSFPLRFRPPATATDPEYADVVVRQTGVGPANQPLGGIVFFTGLSGAAFYGDIQPFATTTVSTLGANYTTFEVRWILANPSEISTAVNIPGNPVRPVNQTLNAGTGFVSGSEGYGGAAANCGVREVLEWISLNRTPLGDQKICATGNSGGGMQIAYATSLFGGADFLKSAVLSGGPSYSRIFNGCFGTEY